MSKVDRRQFLLGIILTMAGEEVLQGSRGGNLTVDLTQWQTITIVFNHKQKTIHVKDVFEEF